MRAVIICIAFNLFLLFSSCSEDSPTNSLTATYKYIGYNDNGNTVITGYLWIESVDSTTVKGRWDFKRIKGNFEGIKDSQGSMSLNLNPEWVDNNVILDGSLLNSDYDGNWSYVGFPGVINSGSFEAKQLH